MMPTDAELIALIVDQSLKDASLFKLNATLEETGVDSVDMVSIFFALEDKYDIHIEYEEISRDQTVGEVFALIRSKINTTEAS